MKKFDWAYYLYLVTGLLGGRFWWLKKKVHIASSEQRQETSKIFDQQFAWDYWQKNLAKVPAATRLVKIEQKIFKKKIGHFNISGVIRYRLYFINRDGQEENCDYFFSASTDNNRYQSYLLMKHLARANFGSKIVVVATAVDYLKTQQCLIYRGVPGETMHELLLSDAANKTALIKLAAQWLKYWHQLSSADYQDIDLANGYLYLSSPQASRSCYLLAETFPRWGKIAKELITRQVYYEKKFWPRKKSIVHGDYQLENLIINSDRNSAGMVDLTDVVIGNPYRDLGTFIQQLGFMLRLYHPKQQIYNWKRIFLEEYFGCPYEQIKITDFQQINLYQSWTAWRSALYIFLMKGAKSLVVELLKDSQKYLQLVEQNKKTVNIK
ncbi:MAG: hypothetical protein COX77_04275 [Candidatus Komeilibacteria bacterium CG_4_10_14_0_2_um_filter_37_10]|uniref:Aminoglycoside phosphotransferase domain-containing protein n=1 Tax=Candidatus Komeilibacteria bacterium CG_4_10_14_0_2_um_filter_37_10 TaxID=1974470 RepID=A0A2M7VDM1_9BACT|nr:MAG: hypothetical protein COX77_04275 [Candidatus Komeilibacteria bacterium CG_4_10_14_0_2_um_filter_37_10]